MENTDTCLVKLEAFEGPLDLLLYLIKKHEIDIYDIHIALITEQYLQYLELMKELNLEIVGDYLIIAAELGHIKSKMLLPQPPEEDEEEEDPRADMVRRLIEYQRYKDAAEKFSNLEALDRDVFIRVSQDERQEDNESQMLKVDLWSLIDSLKAICTRRNFGWSDGIQFDIETMTLDDRVKQVRSLISLRKTMKFEDLFVESATRFDIVISFLSILELIRTHTIAAYQDFPFAPIKLIYLGA